MRNEAGVIWNSFSRLCWKDRFRQLLEYKEKHGDTQVPQKYPDNPSLATWVRIQRSEYKNYVKGKKPCCFDEEKIWMLSEVGFIWHPVSRFCKNQFRELLEYKEKYGDTVVPQVYPEIPPLVDGL
jgi:hypothetical protein